ncbi:alpha/beta fold hydrolase [Floridanema evergladense]|uniref:Alpha/beta fold hydrolase n=1 Tax=Floridaenema evergladense BLCC-F167 TaxID=3153639 RepID=A0ABV4WNL7_9CYAN
MTTTLLPQIAPTADQINQTKAAIAAYVQRIDANPERRKGAYPYYLFHPPGQPILGTVMVFHGFSAKPHQMWRLADYLFRNGFNVYQPSISGHTYINPAKNWCQIDLRPEIAEPLKQKIQQDPVLQNYLANLSNNSNNQVVRPSFMQRLALMARLTELEPRLPEIILAIERDNDPNFDRYFVSSHLGYLTDARDRLNELSSMPDPIYTAGLSVGGSVALAIAADQPQRIKRCVAYAPLLQIYGEDRRQYVELAGPLDIQELGWDPNLRFPVGALTAAARFGKTQVFNKAQRLRQTPTFMVLTENEDAADIETNQKFFREIGGEGNGNYCYMYPRADLVPHPMVDPTEVSQGMSNHYWQTMYQETYRFLTTSKANLQNLRSLRQDPQLPQVSF